jgi:nitroreductase
MTLLESIQARHSVRNYTDKKIDGEALEQLNKVVDSCNQESGLNIQLCLNEPRAFGGLMAKYGKFTNVRNYIALVGKKGPNLEEKSGYYGEKVVLKAQQLGLNTCWVGLSYSKGKSIANIRPGEKLLMVIAVGYGETNGAAHTIKPIEALCSVNGGMPDWFRCGMEAARLAPTAMNQQKFCFELKGNSVKATAGSGFYTKVDLGIATYHFEAGAGKNGWEWA